MNLPLLQISTENKNLMAFVVCTAAIMFFQKISERKKDKKRDAKDAEVLRTTSNTNETVRQIHKLTDGAFGAAKRAVAISKQNNAVSLRTLANVTDDPKYAGQADEAEREALTAKHDADEHDRRLAELDEQIKRRTAEIAATMSTGKSASKIAVETADAAKAAAETCVVADKAAQTAADAVGEAQEDKTP